MKTLKPHDLRRMLDDGGEIALLDVREEGVYSRDGHLLLASNLPLSHLEMRAAALLPRKNVRVVVCDAGDDVLAQRAAERLTEIGYGDVHVLEGGTRAWRDAGFRLYTGVYVPSKAFGEYVLHEDRPPEVTAQELHAWQQEKRDLIVLDSRPLDEYRRNSIPGAIDCPSAELVYRAHDLVRSNDTVVVVNCGGRTRSIIGAQALINARFPHRVYALKDGTQGWHLAGYQLEHGRTEEAPLPTESGRGLAREAAVHVARRYGIRSISKDALAKLHSDASRTVYLLDVRSPSEFLEGHLPGSRTAPGGQLIQATDTFLAVRHAAVVLIDDDGSRATTTAAWLAQMGWRDVFVLENAFDGTKLEPGPVRERVPDIDVALVSAKELHELLRSGSAAVADLATSLRYAEGHIPGAWHVVRSRLAENLRKIPDAQRLVFTSTESDTLARFAAQDAKTLTSADIAVLEGGNAAWTAAGFPLEKGLERATGPTDDMMWKALDRTPEEREAAIREYLTWEVDLVNATYSDPDFGFRRYA
ncbi:MAG TPA: rhodanese-like domain-containing protein [Burkholderiales bacterium]|nr:rhodanese-like domain-containing protein [Burkholderiales bacterium]